jgi:hypothetical protein
MHRVFSFAVRATGLVLALLMVHGAVTPASATVIYAYEGETFDNFENGDPPSGSYTTDHKVEGTFELPSALGPNFAWSDISGVAGFEYHFTDGRDNHLDTANSTIYFFYVKTGSDGIVNEWYIDVGHPALVNPGDQQVQLWAVYDPAYSDTEHDGVYWWYCNDSPCSTNSTRDAADIAGNHGTWSIIPEPGTAALLGMGLAVLGHRRRRQRA